MTLEDAKALRAVTIALAVVALLVMLFGRKRDESSSEPAPAKPNDDPPADDPPADDPPAELELPPPEKAD